MENGEWMKWISENQFDLFPLLFSVKSLLFSVLTKKGATLSALNWVIGRIGIRPSPN